MAVTIFRYSNGPKVCFILAVLCVKIYQTININGKESPTGRKELSPNLNLTFQWQMQ